MKEENRKVLLTVFTPAYNRAYSLHLCYESLLRQSCKEFLWLIIELEFEKGKCFNLLSVGRFSHAKNFDNIPFIYQAILERGIDVKWYLVGFGGDEQLIRERIEQCGVKEHL